MKRASPPKLAPKPVIELSPEIKTPIWLLAKDQTAPVRITHLFDANGEEVGTWEEANRFVAGPLDSGM